MRVVFLLGVLCVQACNDDVDLTGVYEVTASVGGQPCGNDMPVVSTPPFLKFYKQDILGQDFFAYDGCTDATANECQNIGGLFGGFYEPTDTGWYGYTSFAVGGGSDCTLGYQYQSADRSGDDMVLDSATYSEDASGAACESDEAKRRGKSMPCVQHTRIDATKID